MERSNVINLAAGPSQLPLAVLEQAAAGILNYEGTGIGLVELSHRSKEFSQLTTSLEQEIRTFLDVPPTHVILFTQGGGCGQFSSVVYNLLARHHLLYPDLRPEERVMDYVITGSWSKKAAEEARKLGGGVVNIVADGREHSPTGKAFSSVPPHESWKISPAPAFVYYCENETVDGVQFSPDPQSPSSFPFHLLPQPTGSTAPVPLVADYSSSFLSRPIHNLADHALIYAGAQKNVGPAGLTILIVRKDLLVDTEAAAKLGAAPTPTTLSYKVLADAGSLYHTPPMFSMYVALLVVRYFRDRGGLATLEEANKTKQAKVYDAVERGTSSGIFKGKVKKESRSWMNVTFSIEDAELEKRFIADAESKGIKGVKGHRSVGGIRLSLYNAVTEEQIDRVVAFLDEFIANARSR
ncbi:Phosphoserine transaminase [Tulasnella sp. 419]|nr:Phosphoserine transaminase [Tulasnella sp. 419]